MRFPRFPHRFMFAHGYISAPFSLVRISKRVLEHEFLTFLQSLHDGSADGVVPFRWLSPTSAVLHTLGIR